MGLNVFDFVLIAFYLAGVTLFGLHFRKRQRSLRDYFLAGRDVPWWAISLSIVAAETSTLTIISVPGLAYGWQSGLPAIGARLPRGPRHHLLHAAAAIFSRRTVHRLSS